MAETPASEAPSSTLSGGNSGRGGDGDISNAGLRSRASNLANLTHADREALAELLDTPIRLNVREFLALNLDHTIGRAVAAGTLADGDARADGSTDAYAESDEDSEADASAYAIPEPVTFADAFSDGFAYTAANPYAKAPRLPAYPDVSQGAVDAD